MGYSRNSRIMTGGWSILVAEERLEKHEWDSVRHRRRWRHQPSESASCHPCRGFRRSSRPLREDINSPFVRAWRPILKGRSFKVLSMSSEAENAFHNYIKECTDGEIRDGIFVRYYRGRQDISEIEPSDLRSLLATIKETMNIALAGRNHVAEDFDDLPFHVDFIESDFASAVAFSDGTYAFIGITIPLVKDMRRISFEMSQSARIRQILGVQHELANRLEGLVFDNLLMLIVTHEFAHHVHGHVLRQDGNVKFFSEFDGKEESCTMQKHADEADADGYGTHHVLANTIDSPFRDTAVNALNLHEKSAELIDQTLCCCFVVLTCAYFSSRGLIDLEKNDVLTRPHPPQIVRLHYLLFHALSWCQKGRPLLVGWLTQEMVTLIMKAVAEELWGLESRRPWASQVAFMRSDKGKIYLKELGTLIDGQKAYLRKRSDEAEGRTVDQQQA
jgi:hypothetical protein